MAASSSRIKIPEMANDPQRWMMTVEGGAGRGLEMAASGCVLQWSNLWLSDALAVGGELGILEGRTFALIHPIVMGGLFVYTLWAGYLGWQWRRVRTIQTEINELKKQVKPVAVAPDGSPPPEAPPSPAELKIQQLTE
ncbi:hypothetical protein CRG98_034642, partial [Punica granatum]